MLFRLDTCELDIPGLKWQWVKLKMSKTVAIEELVLKQLYGSLKLKNYNVEIFLIPSYLDLSIFDCGF